MTLSNLCPICPSMLGRQSNVSPACKLGASNPGGYPMSLPGGAPPGALVEDGI